MGPRIEYIGNFEPEHSTENDLRRTMEAMGVDLHCIQEQDRVGWAGLNVDLVHGYNPDAIMWTRTASLSDQIPLDLRRRVQIEARRRHIPTIGVHLDRWWGLQRETSLYNDPFFRCEYLFTADGHDPGRWKALGANHHWMPPAIAPHNAKTGAPDPRFECDIAFVGSWQDYGHTEWRHRTDLVQFLRRQYGKRVKFFPERGQPAVRGDDLADLYASCKVVVGDSCLVPDGDRPWTRYCSDRVFETIGRGGFLVHPYVEGVIDGSGRSLLTPGIHCDGWHLGDWIGLKTKIDQWLALPQERLQIQHQGFKHVAEHHTYRNRLEFILGVTIGFDGQVEGEGAPEDPEAQVRSAGVEEVPDPRPEARSERQGPSDPAVPQGPDLGVDQEQDPRQGEPGPQALAQEMRGA